MNCTGDHSVQQRKRHEPFTVMPNRQLNLRALLGVVAGLIALALVAQVLRSGVFEPHHTYTLIAARAQGLRAGVGVEYAGFAIGRVEHVNLGATGQLEIKIRVSRQYTQWIRADSQFSLEQPIVGTPRILVETAGLRESPLPSGSTRVLRTTRQLDLVMDKGMAIAEQVRLLFATDGALVKTLSNVQNFTASIKDNGLLRPALGDNAAADGLLAALRQSAAATHELQKTLASVQRATVQAGHAATAASRTLDNVDATVTQARALALGPAGTLAEASKTLLAVQGNLQELQKTLANTTRASGSAADAMHGMHELRARVDSISRSVDGMLVDLKRLGLFSRDNEARLP